MSVTSTSCSRCGAAIYPDDLFCAGCGTRGAVAAAMAGTAGEADASAAIAGAEAASPRGQTRLLVARQRGTIIAAASCASCSAALLEGDAFCPGCGAPVAGVSTTQTSDTRADERAVDVAWAEARRRLEAATIGQLEISKELGRGGMAAVFLAREIALDRKVAVKVMAPGLLTGSGMISRFRQEAVTVANLNHPNIVSIYSVQQHENLHYFVMKFVEGRSLEFVLDCEGALPLHTIQAVLYQVGSGLAYAHCRRIVHRDIKPANIMIDTDGNAVVMDFGIAKVTEKEGQTQVGTVIGTPSYMSPEQCYAENITWASDQYSLGIVAYEMLTGQVPFSGPSFVVMQGHTSQPPPPIEPLRPDCPPAVVAAVMRMLEKDPAKRFESMAEALDSLGAVPLAEGDPLREELIRVASLPSNARRNVRPRTPHSPMPAYPGGGGAGGASVRRMAPSIAGAGTAKEPVAAPKSRRWIFAGAGVGLAVAAVSAWLIMSQAETGTPATDSARPAASGPVAGRPVATVAIQGADSVLMGQTATLRAQLADDSGAVLTGRQIAWNTDDSTVASITANGGEATLRARRPGRVKIVAAAEGKSIERAITIVAPLANRVSVSSPASELVLGESVPLVAVLTDSLGKPVPGVTFEWRSSDPRILEIARDGRVTARGPGRARVTAASGARNGSVELSVKGLRAMSVAITPPAAALVRVGGRVTLHATIEWERAGLAGQPRLAWRSSNPAVAVVVSNDSLDAVVNLLSEGSANIVASMDGASASTQLQVASTAVAPVAIALSRNSLTFDVGADGRAPEAQTVTVTLSGGTGREQPSLGEVDYGSGPAGWVEAAIDAGGAGQPSTLTVRAVPRGVAPGAHRASVPVTAGGQSRSVAVTFTVAAAGGAAPVVAAPSGATAVRDELETLLASYEEALNAGDKARVSAVFPGIAKRDLDDVKRRGRNEQFALVLQPRTIRQISDTEVEAVVGASIGGNRNDVSAQARVLYRFRKGTAGWQIASTAAAR